MTYQVKFIAEICLGVILEEDFGNWSVRIHWRPISIISLEAWGQRLGN